jgi:tyrosyl-tRNA synthetase
LSIQLPPNPSLAELMQGAVEALPQGALEAKLKDRDRPLRVKLGFDPTKPDLHLGHAVVLHGLRRFQDAGHQVVIIIGDFTARIGDPSGKEATRPPLSLDEVTVNAQTYLDQLGLILDLSKTEVHWNGEWLDRMTFADTVKLAAQATVAQMLARDNFAKRYERNDPIALHEFLYPLMQGYDSVAIRSDIEMGGTDQKFNLLMGREIQEAYGQSPQVVMMYPILEGTDGVQKMSKSLNNYIGLTDAPEDMYGKVMSIPDTLLANYYRLASGLPLAEVTDVLAGLEAGTTHPRDAKMRLARAIVGRYHGADAGAAAEEAFVRQFQQRQLPEDIPDCPVPEAAMPAAALLAAMGLASSSSEARRLIQQGGMKLHRTSDPETVKAFDQLIELGSDGVIVQVGKRRFGRAVHES